METINVLQLQLNAKLLNPDQPKIKKVTMSTEKLDLFKSKMIEFLGNYSTIQISNRNNANKNEDGFIVLTISSEGLTILDSSSIKKSEFKFLFKTNLLMLNDRDVDLSFLDSFVRKIMFVASRVELDEYDVIKL